MRSRPNAFSAGRLDFLLVLGLARGALRVAGGGFLAAFAALAAGKLRIELAENFVAGALDVDVERLEHAGGDALALAEQAEQDVLGADVGVVERLRFLAGERQDLLHARRVGNAALGLRLLAGAHLLFHGGAHGLEVEAHLLQHAHGDALPQLDQPEQDVLGADIVVVEAVGFLAGQREHLLGARREVVHRFLGHVVKVGMRGISSVRCEE